MARFVFAVVILCNMLGGTKPVVASGNRSCDFIETLVSLRTDLATLRETQGNAADFERNLTRSLNNLEDRWQTAVFSQSELRALRIFAGAVREDWKLNGASATGRQIPGLTSTSTTIQSKLLGIIEKFGCEPPGYSGNAPLWSVGSAPVSQLLLILSLVAVVVAGLGIFQLTRIRNRVARNICHVPALLRYDGICTVTTILDISRGGAMIEAPVDGFPCTEVVLHMPGLSIASRVAWANKKFAGLNFDKLISARQVEKIADASNDSDQPDDLTDVAPACFKPGCHQSCKTHRITSQTLQIAPVREV